MPDKHSSLSPSASTRWLACPPSVQLEKQFPDKGSEFAAEGTYAHAMGEYILRRVIDEVDYPDNLVDFDTSSEFFSESMVEYVRMYTDACIEKMNAAKKADPDAACLVEQELHFDSIAPGGFGTGDMVIIADGMLEIVDLKYGKGVAVEAEGNTQLQLYALGAIETFGYLYDFDKVKMTIVQPRLGGISEQTMTVKALNTWGKKVKKIAKLAIEGKGDFCAGEHCRFCKAAPRCKALADYNLELARLEFKDATLLTDDEIADVLKRVDDLKHYADMIAKYALDEAVAGRHKWPGFKLVEGRSRRVYRDTEAIMQLLSKQGYSPDNFLKPAELIGVTDMTKLLTKKRFEELLGNYIEKPQGTPTLVPAEDKRPEFIPGQDDFEDLDKQEEN